MEFRQFLLVKILYIYKRKSRRYYKLSYGFNSLNTLMSMTTFAIFAVDVASIVKQRNVFDYGCGLGGAGYSAPMFDSSFNMVEPSLNLINPGLNMMDPSLNLSRQGLNMFDPSLNMLAPQGFANPTFVPVPDSSFGPNFNIFDKGGFGAAGGFDFAPTNFQPTFQPNFQPSFNTFAMTNPFAMQPISNPFFEQSGLRPSGARAKSNPSTTQPIANHVKGSNPTPKYKYTSEVNTAAQKYGVDPALVNCIIQQESRFQPNVTSGTGAMGLMQLMPATAKELGVTNAYDPIQNIDGGTKYIAQLLKRYNGDVTKAVAAYNGGMGNIAKYGVGFCEENRNYVEKVVGAYNAQLAAKKS